MDVPQKEEKKKPMVKLRESAVTGAPTPTTCKPVVGHGGVVPGSIADRHRFAKFVPTEEQEAAFILMVMNKEDLGLLEFRKEKKRKQSTDGQK
jgi:hypothetical protein